MNSLQEIAKADFRKLLSKGEKTRIHLVINSGNRTSTVFLLQENASWPFGVLRISHRTEHIEKEFNILRTITQYENKYLLRTVPYPYNLHSFGRLRIASFSYLKGDYMIPSIKRRSCVKGHFQKTREWLAGLAGIPIPDFLLGENIYREFSLRCDYVLKNINHPSFELIDLLEQIKSVEKMLKQKNTPLMISHTDLHWNNIILIENQIGVLDWETVGAWWPLMGWLYFIFTYLERLFSSEDRSPELKCRMLAGVFFKKSWLSQFILSETLKLMEDLSLDKDLIYEFYLLGIFNYLYCKFWYDFSVFNNAAFLFEKKHNIFYLSPKGLF